MSVFGRQGQEEARRAQPANVTLLGDAIHAMTPTLGRGANVAMRVGAMLGREPLPQ